MSDNNKIHGTGRTANSAPTFVSNVEDKREQLSAIKRMQTLKVKAHKAPEIIPAGKPKIRIVGDPDADLMSVNEPFRNKKESQTTVISVNRNHYDDDEDEGFALDCDEIRSMLEDGPIKFRFLVLCSAIFMVIASIFEYNQQKYYSYYGVSPLFYIISLYVWIFGAFIISLEIMPFSMGVSSIHKMILEQMNILRFTWGRGFFYFFSGSLQFSLFTKWNMVAGGVMMIVGISSILIGRAASKKLKILVRRIGNKNNLKQLFARHDRDRDGYLSVYEFKNFVSDMDVGLNDDELTNAFLAIDRDNDRLITFTDLANWYASAKYEVKTDGVII